jgi:hypothetical protein
MRKSIITMGLVAAMLSAPAIANTFNYGLGNASIKAGGDNYAGLTYHLGANFAIAEDFIALVDYSMGTLEKTGQTNIDYTNSYVGIKYAAYDMDDIKLSLNLGGANVSAKQNASKVKTAVNNSGIRYGVGFNIGINEASNLGINIDRDNSARITVTNMAMRFVLGENMSLNMRADHTTDLNAYSIGLSHNF